MARNDGKRLEDIVAMLETTRLPEGSTVERRHPVFNDDGVQIAELDIFITSPLAGSMTVKSLIECRDRPSAGAAPIDWIEQLDSRRRRLKLDKVMAVSSTGFSPEARDWAEKSAIELRTFESLTPDSVQGWLPRFAPLMIGTHHLVQVRVMYAADETLVELKQRDFEPVPDPANFRRTQFDSSLKNVIERSTGKRMTFRDLWNDAVQAKNYYDGLKPGDKKTEMVTVERDTLAKYAVEIDGRVTGLFSLEFETSFTNEWSKIPLVTGGSYTNEAGEKLYDVAHWKGEPTDDVREFWVILTPRKKPPEA